MVAMTAAMRPFFTFFGGKWRLAPKYPAPQHDTIIEPFAGSAGYSVRYNAERVILLDIDPTIIGVWQYLIGASEREVLALPDVAHDRTVDDYGLCQEARDFVGFWMNKAMTGPCNKPSKWLRSGIRPDSSWGQVTRDRIAAQLPQIRHWQAYNLPWWEAPDIKATWFVDPPYMERGTRYRFGSGLLDFAKLGEWCQERDGQVIACENEGADWLPFEPFADAKTARSNRSAEVVYLAARPAPVTAAPTCIGSGRAFVGAVVTPTSAVGRCPACRQEFPAGPDGRVPDHPATKACVKCKAPEGTPGPCAVDGVYSGDLHQWHPLGPDA